MNSERTTPQFISRYKIIEVLGKGSMGVVYKAYDPVLDREVAIKTIEPFFDQDKSELDKFIERFKREAIAAGKLNHPSIITIHDFGFINEKTPYIVMEFIKGKTLKEYFEEGIRFDLNQICNILLQIAQALDYAHSNNIIHRDIKPANIMIQENFIVKIADFGIAKIPQSELTRTGEILGTPNYMSPEQITGIPLDQKADLFALGVILYQMLTGEKPFYGETFNSLAYKIVHQNPIPPKTLNPSIPQSLNDIAMQLLEKNRELRPTAKELINVLNKIRSDSATEKTFISQKLSPDIHQLPTEEVQLQELSFWDKSLEFVNTHIKFFAMAIVFLLLLFGITIFTTNKEKTPQKQTASLAKAKQKSPSTEAAPANKQPPKSSKSFEEEPPEIYSPSIKEKNEIEQTETQPIPDEEIPIIQINKVKHRHTIGNCQGTLIFSQNYLQFIPTKGKDARKWLYSSLRGFELKNRTLKIKTYEKIDLDVIKIANRDYNFTLPNTSKNPDIYQLLKEKIKGK